MGTASLAAGSTIPVLDQLWPGTTFVSVAPSTGVSGVSCNATASPLAFSVTLATALAAGTEATPGPRRQVEHVRGELKTARMSKSHV